MNDENIDKLQEKYPIILKNLGGDPGQTCMSWMHGGIACGDGWYQLLDDIMGWCQFQTDKNCYPQVIAEQIKEKFGTLRFYYTLEDNPKLEELKKTVHKPEYAHRPGEMLEGAISFAEYMSGRICEHCGYPGKVRGTRWRVCACDECAVKLKIDLTDEEIDCEEDEE